MTEVLERCDECDQKSSVLIVAGEGFNRGVCPDCYSTREYQDDPHLTDIEDL